MRYPVEGKTERMLSHQFKLDKTYQQLYSLSRTHFAHWGDLILYPRNIHGWNVRAVASGISDLATGLKVSLNLEKYTLDS